MKPRVGHRAAIPSLEAPASPDFLSGRSAGCVCPLDKRSRLTPRPAGSIPAEMLKGHLFGVALRWLVEAAGIEPASASPLPEALHA